MSKSLNVMMIGNSFSICVGKFLPQMVRCFSGNRLKLTSCYIGGCSFETHWNNFSEAEKNPDFKPYRITVWDSTTLKKPKFPGNVNALLKNETFDVVTIQEASRCSVDYALYQPYADRLISAMAVSAPENYFRRNAAFHPNPILSAMFYRYDTGDVRTSQWRSKNAALQCRKN